MKSQSNYYGKNQSEITEATGQLRIELRIYSSKLNYHNKKINGDFFADIIIKGKIIGQGTVTE